MPGNWGEFDQKNWKGDYTTNKNFFKKQDKFGNDNIKKNMKNTKIALNAMSETGYKGKAAKKIEGTK